MKNKINLIMELKQIFNKELYDNNIISFDIFEKMQEKSSKKINMEK